MVGVLEGKGRDKIFEDIMAKCFQMWWTRLNNKSEMPQDI